LVYLFHRELFISYQRLKVKQKPPGQRQLTQRFQRRNYKLGEHFTYPFFEDGQFITAQ